MAKGSIVDGLEEYGCFFGREGKEGGDGATRHALSVGRELSNEGIGDGLVEQGEYIWREGEKGGNEGASWFTRARPCGLKRNGRRLVEIFREMGLVWILEF